MRTKKSRFAKITAFIILNIGLITGSLLPAFAMVQSGDFIHFQQYATPNGTASFGQGNASITIKPNGLQSLSGKSFHVYKLFNAENAVGQESINYTFNQKYAPALKAVVGTYLKKEADKVTEYEVIDYIQTLNTHQTEGAQTVQELEGSYSDYRYFIEELRSKITEMNLMPDTVNVSQVKSDGSFTLGGLSFGYYIIDEVTDVQDTHQAASLIMVSTANPTATVHIKSDYPEVIKKIYEDDGSTGWNDIADFEIGQTVPYKYESDIPNMNGYDSYYYAYHDIMNECLTFHKDSLKITISDGTKSYHVKASEFNVNTDISGLTFKAEIKDIKKIVDREFNSMNNENENIYGQTVTVTFDASLNDKAALYTGRPGFENTVRLEFSNNPDHDGLGETGFTPWDTVVCFTFKTNISKINDDGKALADAKFRLYSDANCQNEVFVKETSGGYIVINRDSVNGNDHTGGTKPAEAVEMKSNTKGLFTIFGLDSGTYYLKETDSPAGYRELENPIRITITADYVEDRNRYLPGDGATDKALIHLTAASYVKEFLNLTWNDKDETLMTNTEDGSVNLIVINTVGTKLPVTGPSIFMSIGTIGIITLLISAGIVLSKKTRSEKCKNEI